MPALKPSVQSYYAVPERSYWTAPEDALLMSLALAIMSVVRANIFIGVGVTGIHECNG